MNTHNVYELIRDNYGIIALVFGVLIVPAIIAWLRKDAAKKQASAAKKLADKDPTNDDEAKEEQAAAQKELFVAAALETAKSQGKVATLFAAIFKRKP